MALSKIDVANMLTGATPVANGGTGATSFTAGITEVDSFRLNDDESVDGTTFLSDYERDDSNFSKIGTGLTESGGVFTFPSTGIYLINAYFLYSAAGNDAVYCGGEIYTTTDNSSYSADVEAYSFIYNGMSGATEHSSASVSTIFDVTNTTTHKFKLRAATSAAVTLKGNSTINKTHFVCYRLGDT